MSSDKLNTRLLSQLKRKLRAKKSVTDLAEELGVSRRTIYRYLKILDDQGIRVHRVGITRPTLYRIGERK